MTQIKKISDHTAALHLDDGRVYILSNTMDGSIRGSFGQTIFRNDAKDWEVMPHTIGDYKIVPYGWNNNIPVFI